MDIFDRYAARKMLWVANSLGLCLQQIIVLMYRWYVTVFVLFVFHKIKSNLYIEL